MQSDGPTWREWQAHIQSGHMVAEQRERAAVTMERRLSHRPDRLEARVNTLFAMLAGIQVIAGIVTAVAAFVRLGSP